MLSQLIIIIIIINIIINTTINYLCIYAYNVHGNLVSIAPACGGRSTGADRLHELVSRQC